MAQTDTPRSTQGQLYETESIGRILLRTTPPIMLAQLILALYNIVDSFFVGLYSGDGLTALSVVFPIQLLITALSTGTGVGVNTLMSRCYALREHKRADDTGGTGMLLALVSWLLFTLVVLPILRPFAAVSSDSAQVAELTFTYGSIICIGAPGVFLESIWTKVHQAAGNMRRPMAAQIVGAVTNIILDPILIFGVGPIPSMGVAGAAIATVIGQCAAAAIVFKGGVRRIPALKTMRPLIREIYRLGYPSICMQALYTVYIAILNMILAGFSDAAVTVLGLYYKLQSFFFIPLYGMQTGIVPLMSYNYARRAYDRCRRAMNLSTFISVAFMLVGVFCFECIPGPLLRLFSRDAEVLRIGIPAFRIIGSSFISAGAGLMCPVFFQAIGRGRESVFLSLLRQIFCLVPFFWVFSLIGLSWTWLAFPVSETITAAFGLTMYRRELRRWESDAGTPNGSAAR